MAIIPSSNQSSIDSSNNITYTGNVNKKISKSSPTEFRGSLDFYWGDVVIFVKGDFVEASFYRGADDPVVEGPASFTGYAGGERVFVYSESCKNHHKIDNSIAAVTKAIVDIDSENGTIDLLKDCVNSLQLMKRYIGNQKKKLEETLYYATEQQTTGNLLEEESLLIAAVSNVNTTENRSIGARRKYEGGGGVAIINNKYQIDGSGNKIIGGAKFSKRMIDEFLDDIIISLEQFNGERNYDIKIGDESNQNVSAKVIDISTIEITCDNADDKAKSLKKGDVVFINDGDDDNFKLEYIVLKDAGVDVNDNAGTDKIIMQPRRKIGSKIYDTNARTFDFVSQNESSNIKLKFNKHGSNASGNAGKLDIEF
jgi:co-chaperonin GroES (HSP10)